VAKDNAQRSSAFTVRLQKSRKEISGALGRTLALLRCSQAKAARSMRVRERTVWNWLNDVTPVNVELVLASRLLGHTFRQELCSHEHDDVPFPTLKRSSK
jgi:hypothetical protein